MAAVQVRTLLGLIVLLTLSQAVKAQPAAEPPAAPLPAQFVSAKRVFVANGAGDNDPGISKYTLGPDGLYNQFYADVKAIGRYEMVASPAEADIVLELRVDYALFERFPYPKVRVEVRDPKSNVLLWSFTEPVQDAFLAKAGRKNVGVALAQLTDDMKKVLGAP
jgi:hypothetical protein